MAAPAPADGELADEADFLEAIVAGERVGEWLDRLRAAAAGGPPGPAAAVCRELGAAVRDRAVYREEAELQGAAEVVAALAGRHAGAGEASVGAAARQCLQQLRAAERAAPRIRTFRCGGEAEVEVAVYEEPGLSGAGLGGRVWLGAHHLCEALARWPELVRGQRVLELGCGCGTVGLFAAKLGAATVTLTDGDPRALAGAARSLGLTGSTDDRVRVSALDWRTDAADGNAADLEGPEEGGREPGFPVVVGADLVYEDEQAELLPHVLAKRLRPGGRALLCLKERSAALLTSFDANCRALGLALGYKAVEDDDTSGNNGQVEFDGGHVLVAVEHAAERSEDSASMWGIDGLRWQKYGVF